MFNDFGAVKYGNSRPNLFVSKIVVSNRMIDNSKQDRFYEVLFRSIERTVGSKFDPDTIAAIIGFEVGGPVALRTIANRGIYVTSELAIYPDQHKSTDGFPRYELMTEGDFDLETARMLLTAIGAMSLSTTLGDSHTIDVSAIMDGNGPSIVAMNLYSRVEFEGSHYGIYRLSPVS
jgi:hypothetical protein